MVDSCYLFDLNILPEFYWSINSDFHHERRSKIQHVKFKC